MQQSKSYAWVAAHCRVVCAASGVPRELGGQPLPLTKGYVAAAAVALSSLGCATDSCRISYSCGGCEGGLNHTRVFATARSRIL